MGDQTSKTVRSEDTLRDGFSLVLCCHEADTQKELRGRYFRSSGSHLF